MEKFLQHKNIILAVALVALIIPVIIFGISRNSSPTQNQEIINKKWYLTSINQEKMANSAYVEFKEDKTVSGFAGCNSFSGSYELLSINSGIKIGTLASTKRACVNEQDQAAENNMFKVLEDANNYELSQDTLVISSSSESLYFSSNALESSAIIGSWTLSKIYTNNEEFVVVNGLEDRKPQIEFTKEGRLNGTICNSFGADFELQSEPNQILISEAQSTLMFCTTPETLMEQESIVLASLPKISSYQVMGNTLVLNVDDNNYLKFTK